MYSELRWGPYCFPRCGSELLRWSTEDIIQIRPPGEIKRNYQDLRPPVCLKVPARLKKQIETRTVLQILVEIYNICCSWMKKESQTLRSSKVTQNSFKDDTAPRLLVLSNLLGHTSDMWVTFLNMGRSFQQPSPAAKMPWLLQTSSGGPLEHFQPSIWRHLGILFTNINVESFPRLRRHNAPKSCSKSLSLFDHIDFKNKLWKRIFYGLLPRRFLIELGASFFANFTCKSSVATTRIWSVPSRAGYQPLQFCVCVCVRVCVAGHKWFPLLSCQLFPLWFIKNHHNHLQK